VNKAAMRDVRFLDLRSREIGALEQLLNIEAACDCDIVCCSRNSAVRSWEATQSSPHASDFFATRAQNSFAYTNMTAEADAAKRWSSVGGEQAFLVSVTKATMPVYVLR
jgi:hypothetical protein